MSILLLNLRHVPDDESDDVRALLDAHRIAWYETPPNRWGISAGAIWLADEIDAGRAMRLMAEYQGDRQARVRAEYAAARRDGRAPTGWSILRDDPLRVALTLLATAFLLGLLALPVFLMSR